MGWLPLYKFAANLAGSCSRVQRRIWLEVAANLARQRPGQAAEGIVVDANAAWRHPLRPLLLVFFPVVDIDRLLLLQLDIIPQRDLLSSSSCILSLVRKPYLPPSITRSALS